MFIGWKTQHHKYISFYQHLPIGSMKSHSKSQHGGEICEHVCNLNKLKK